MATRILQSLCLLGMLCVTLPPLLVGALPPPYEYEFGFSVENGVEKSTCSAVFKISYEDHVIDNGIRKAINKTITMHTSTCCPGYEQHDGKCFLKDPDDPCKSLTCNVEGAECYTIKRCGHKLAVFMKEEELLEECHDRSYLDVLTCPGRCEPASCHPSRCPLLNSTEVMCISSNDCSCMGTWLRKSDNAEMDCQTGRVKDKCSDEQ